jgi:hypothetical protein
MTTPDERITPMLGRKTSTREEFAKAGAVIDQQLAAYRALSASPEREAFEPLFFNGLVLELDRLFVHRIRAVSGKDGNALNEVELLTESLMNNYGVLQGNNVIKYVPEKAVVGITVGDRIALTAEQFDGLYRAFLDELERKFVTEG